MSKHTEKEYSDCILALVKERDELKAEIERLKVYEQYFLNHQAYLQMEVR